LGTSDDGAVEIQDGAVQRAVVGEVEADHLQAGAVDVDQDRGLAHPSGGAPPDLDGVAAVEERGDQLGDGHLGQAQ
jgi:hypothetical protein